jgi:hypothetical protein
MIRTEVALRRPPRPRSTTAATPAAALLHQLLLADFDTAAKG